MTSLICNARQKFHQSLCDSRVLTIDNAGIPSNADPKKLDKVIAPIEQQNLSAKLAAGIYDRLDVARLEPTKKLAGQTAGSFFEESCMQFLEETFPHLSHMRPGKWRYKKGGVKLADFDQYRHLVDLQERAEGDTTLGSALGFGYVIVPDVVIFREAEDDSEFNSMETLIDDSIGQRASLRKSAGAAQLIHASISCKWTFRSDRAQNARSEALNMIRNRKGRAPHIIVVTGEPLPSRLASLALGTGDLDFIYHFALPELRDAASEIDNEEAVNLLNMMIEGDRLKDISDLPLDLAV